MAIHLVKDRPFLNRRRILLGPSIFGGRPFSNDRSRLFVYTGVNSSAGWLIDIKKKTTPNLTLKTSYTYDRPFLIL